MVFGFGEGGSIYSTTIAVTLPEVASILVNGVQRVPTVAMPGLPYGLRGARIVTRQNEPIPPAIKQRVRRDGTLLEAFNAEGRQLPERRNRSHRQARVLGWRYPSHPAGGPCELSAKGLPGLVARAGEVATDIRPFPGKIVGQAFLPCVETQYQLGREPVRAFVLLNAADPPGRAGALPNFRPVRGAPGFFAEGGTLTAKPWGNFWLLAGQGSGLQQRIELLRHLTARVRFAD